MSAIQFLTSGGIASIGGDLSEIDKQAANAIVKFFGEKLKKYARTLQVPASILKVQQCVFLFIAKDTASFHFVFAEAPGQTTLNYRNLSTYGRIELQSLIHQIRIDVGDVVWAFSCPLNVGLTGQEEHIQEIVQQYVNSTLQLQKKPEKSISTEAVSTPEIATGLEKFREDYPIGNKTAFIIMQFGTTAPRSKIVTCIKNTLKKHGVIGLRADDKEYMEDLLPNIKTYMHACDFGIAVHDRITEDDFNPNVSFEVGYMLGMGKMILHLKDQTLKALQTDLSGKLYKSFDTNNIEGTMSSSIEKWLSDKGLA